MRLAKEEAGGFYAVHRERPFFGELTDFMSSGKIFAMVLEAEGAILKWRDTMGATDPKKDRKSTRLNSSHTVISYAVFCLKKKKKKKINTNTNRQKYTQQTEI